MEIKKLLHFRKYLVKIFLFIFVTILLIIPAFSGIMFVNVRNNLLAQELDNSKKILIQTKNNIQNMDDIVKNICITDFYNGDVRALMYLKHEDIYQNLMFMERIKVAQLGTSTFIHSLYIYNNNEKAYYSTINPIVHTDRYLDDLLKTYEKVPVLKPLIRKIETVNSNGTTDTSRVLSYVYYDVTDNNNVMDGAVIVNVKTDWLFNSIREINSIGGKNNDNIFIMDQKGEGINNVEIDDEFRSELMNGYYMANRNNQLDLSKPGYFYQTVKGEKYFISYIHLENYGWTLFKVRLYKEISSSLNAVKAIIFLVTSLFLVLALFLSFFVSGRIYKPVAEILKDLKGERNTNSPDLNERVDDISYIRATIRDAYKELDRYDMERINTRQIIKSYFLRRLLLESNFIKEEEFLSTCNEHGIGFTPDGVYHICIIKLDHYKDIKAQNFESDIRHMKFALCNILSEIIAEEYVNVAIDMDESHVAVIINNSCEPKDFYQKLKGYLNNARERIIQYFSFSFSAALSSHIQGYNNISKIYYAALENSMYRYSFGHMSIITQDDVKQNILNDDADYSFEDEAKLMEMIKKGELIQADALLQSILNNLKVMNYNSMILYSYHLVNSIRKLFFEINRSRLEPINIAKLLSGSFIAELETIEELYCHITDLFKYMGTNETESKNEKYCILAQRIKDIIDTKYQDSNLNAARIAMMLKITSTHIGRVFNDYFNMSIPEYIGSVRMNKAVEWMQNSKLSINEIMLKVGIDNERNFYKLFKNKFGTTPRGYIQQISIESQTD